MRVKCVIVGDGTVGKTSLIISYTTSGFPSEYVPTAFDNYNVFVTVNREPVQLQLCDTAGQDDFDRLRPLSYPGVDVFLLCFSIVNPTSFFNIHAKWLPELRSTKPQVPIVLIGTQLDLRNDVKVLVELAGYDERPISEDEGRSAAEAAGAFAYIECSALTQKNLKDVFDAAIMAALKGLEAGQQNNSSRRCCVASSSSSAARPFDSVRNVLTTTKTTTKRRKGLRCQTSSRPSGKPWWRNPFGCLL